MVAHKRAAHQHKRHGHHQKRTKHFLKVYSPYVPLVLIVMTGLVLSTYWQPKSHHGVLAYATSMSVSDLLSSTNDQRIANGLAGLSLNGQLDNAAQAKANDMAARNYWSHNTPEGNPPWVFINNAGYQYKAAGENLAYGFTTSSDTVAGWMNSAGHRANILNGTYSEVGFGFANSSDYQNSGPETIVVAMYGAPKVTAPAPAPVTSTPAPAAKATPSTEPALAPPPAQSDNPPAGEKPVKKQTPVATQSSPSQSAVAEPTTQRVSRLQTLTQGSTPWIASMVTLIAIVGAAALVLKHGLALRKAMVKSERYVLHHALFDITIISLIGLCFVISRTAGFIR
jgi:hypothetical protein